MYFFLFINVFCSDLLFCEKILQNTELTCFCIIFCLITIHLSKGKSCQLKPAGMEFTKVSKCFVEKHENSSLLVIDSFML